MCVVLLVLSVFFFFFNDTATTEIYTLSLHDALPISTSTVARPDSSRSRTCSKRSSARSATSTTSRARSEEHTSELQSQSNLVCRLLLEKKNKTQSHMPATVKMMDGSVVRASH